MKPCFFRMLASGLLILLAGCARTLRPPEVRHFGALHEIMHGGSMDSVVDVNNYAELPGVHAVGARAGLEGEVTILDGRVWLTAPQGNHEFQTQVSPLETAEGAALLVVSEVGRWREFTLSESCTLDELESRIRGFADECDWSADHPFPILIKAEFPEIHSHIVDGSRIMPGDTPQQHHQAGIQLHERDQPAVFVGFYSESHGGIFTHRGKRLHVHVVVESKNYTAHVDEAIIPVGARVFLPY